MNSRVYALPGHHPGTRRLPAFRVTMTLALAMSTAVSLGCSSSVGTPSPRAGNAASTAAIDLDRQFIIGPTAARELGYRIQWRAQTPPQADSGVKQLSVQQDSVFTLDGRNHLTRLRREDGKRLWRVPVADPLDEIQGITFLPHIERILLTSGVSLFVLDADTGSQIDKQQLGQIANTAPVVVGPFLVYGSRNGQLVWHSYEVGYQWRGYQVSSSIQVQPLLADGYVVTVGTDGRIMAIDASSATGLWDKPLLDSVVAAPVAGQGMVYVAGLDQHLWALDLNTGRNVWRYLTESPLADPPMLIGDRLYQQITTEGLVCFHPMPLDAPGGEVIWTAPDVRGNVIGENRNHALVWNEEQRRLTMVEVAQGAAIRAVELPQVRHLQVSALQGGDLFAAGDDGQVIRLTPRN